MKTLSSLALVLAVCAALAPRAAAEKGRYDALKNLILQLPETNPGAEDNYLDFLGQNLPDQMGTCHYDQGTMEFMEKLLALFDKYRTKNGWDTKALIRAISQLPEFQGPEHKKDLESLSLGIRVAPEITRGRLIARDCRTMLKSHFDNGATRELLLSVLETHKARLEGMPAPKD